MTAFRIAQQPRFDLEEAKLPWALWKRHEGHEHDVTGPFHNGTVETCWPAKIRGAANYLDSMRTVKRANACVRQQYQSCRVLRSSGYICHLFDNTCTHVHALARS